MVGLNMTENNSKVMMSDNQTLAMGKDYHRYG